MQDKNARMANILSTEKQVLAISLLAEGNSIRGIERVTGIHRDTIMRLGVRVGQNCGMFLDQRMRNLNCQRIEVDEVWAFVGKKESNRLEADLPEKGDAWVFLSIDPETKLMPAYLVGKRTRYNTHVFIEDLAARLKNRVQLSSDGMDAYIEAVDGAFGAEVDYGQVVKTFSLFIPEEKRKYSPVKQQAIFKRVICGEPKTAGISTSMIERSNLTIRTHCKRMARLTLSFSKKLENFKAAVALHLFYYNLVKFHGTIRMTPAMAAGVESSPLTIQDMLDL